MHDLSASRSLNRQLVLLVKTHLAMERFPAQKAAAGQTLHSAGDALTRLPIIERGCIEAIHYLGEEGNSIIPITFKAGELAFASALFSTAAIKVDLVVAEDLVAHWVPITELERCLLDSPPVMVLTLRFLAQRLREVQARERDWMERGTHERVCAALSRIIGETESRPDGRLLIAATHEHLAARSGVSRPKLSRELKQLERSGRLKLLRGIVEVLDPESFTASRWNKRSP
jgi:CRP-like cAMP-binding protein